MTAPDVKQQQYNAEQIQVLGVLIRFVKDRECTSGQPGPRACIIWSMKL